MDPIEAKIAAYIAENMLYRSEGYPYVKDASFLENGIIDSMNVLELVMFVEEVFGIAVSDTDITPEHFDSVERLARYIHARQ